LTHGVVGRRLSGAAPAGAGDVLRGRPHLAGLIRHGLGVHLETARHGTHCVRVGHKARWHIPSPHLVVVSLSKCMQSIPAVDRLRLSCRSVPPNARHVFSFFGRHTTTCLGMTIGLNPYRGPAMAPDPLAAAASPGAPGTIPPPAASSVAAVQPLPS